MELRLDSDVCRHWQFVEPSPPPQRFTLGPHSLWPGAGRPNAGSSGTGRPDAGSSGTGRPNAGSSGTGRPDAGSSGTGRPDAGSFGTGRPDAGSSGTGRPDARSSGTGRPDAGRPTTLQVNPLPSDAPELIEGDYHLLVEDSCGNIVKRAIRLAESSLTIQLL